MGLQGGMAAPKGIQGKLLSTLEQKAWIGCCFSLKQGAVSWGGAWQ